MGAKPFYTVTDIAKMVGVTRRQVDYLLKHTGKGIEPAIELGGAYGYTVAVLDMVTHFFRAQSLERAQRVGAPTADYLRLVQEAYVEAFDRVCAEQEWPDDDSNEPAFEPNMTADEAIADSARVLAKIKARKGK